MSNDLETREEVPAYLYKYRSLSGENRERTLSSIVNGGLWFASPLDFKDQNDCKIPVRYETTPEEFRAFADPALSVQMNSLSAEERCALIDEAIKNEVHLDTERIKNFRFSHEKSIMERGVLSLCSTNTSEWMWREYADDHRGCCLEFKTGKRGMFANAERARYEEKLPTVDALGPCYVEMNDAIMLTKTDDYSFEHEWRIWDSRGRGYFKHNEGDLTGLIFGHRMPPEDKELVAYLTLKSHTSAKFYEAVESDGKIKIIPASSF